MISLVLIFNKSKKLKLIFAQHIAFSKLIFISRIAYQENNKKEEQLIKGEVIFILNFRFVSNVWHVANR